MHTPLEYYRGETQTADERVRRAALCALAYLFCLCLSAPVWAADIRVRLDRNPVLEDESFMIVFDIQGSSGAKPDFSPLGKDFSILNRGHSNSIQIMNGRTTTSEQWTLEVQAKRSGRLTIPPIHFGPDRSPALHVDVQTRTQDPANHGQDPEIFFKITVDTKHPYVQAQVLYTVQLFIDSNLVPTLGNMSLSDPALEYGIVKRLNQRDRQYRVHRGPKYYQVVERRYALFAERSGKASIEPPVFKAVLIAFNPSSRSPSSRQRIRRGEAVTLDIRAIPQTFTGTHWLPARQLRISEQWSTEPLALQQGEPVTRGLRLDALGALASQLPELTASLSTDFKNYPEKPQLEETTTREGISSTLMQNAAVIPGRAGILTMPEVSIPWWNTETERQEWARLAPRQIQVLAAAPEPSTGSAPLSDKETGLSDISSVNSPQDTPHQKADTTAQAPDIWKWLALASLLLWVLTAAGSIGFRNWHPRRIQSEKEDKTKAKRRSLLRRLQTACRANNAEACKTCLLDWARWQWPDDPPHTLRALAARVPQPAATALHTLGQSLYGQGSTDWQDGERLLRGVQAIPPRSAETAHNRGTTLTSRLEPLYPK